MNLIFLISFLGLAAGLLFRVLMNKEYNWSIKKTLSLPTNSEGESRIRNLFENLKFMDYHPFCTSNKFISKNPNEKVFELIEELKVFDLIPIKLVSNAYMTKLPTEENSNLSIYRVYVEMKVLGVIRTEFISEFHLTRGEKEYQLEERVSILGPELVTYIVGKIAYPEHQLMLSKIQNDFK